MEDEYELDAVYQVWDTREGICLEVRPHPEGGNALELHTPDKKSKEWYGDISLTLSKRQAITLAGALLKSAEEESKP